MCRQQSESQSPFPVHIPASLAAAHRNGSPSRCRKASRQARWYVTAQSTNLSMLSPDLYGHTRDFTSVSGEQYTTAYGATVSVSVPGRAGGADLLDRRQWLRGRHPPIGDLTGAFGLKVNFGSPPQSPRRFLHPTPWCPSSPTREAEADYAYSQIITIGHISGLGYVYSLNAKQGNGTKNPPPSNGAAGGSAKTASTTQRPWHRGAGRDRQRAACPAGQRECGGVKRHVQSGRLGSWLEPLGTPGSR